MNIFMLWKKTSEITNKISIHALNKDELLRN